MQAPASPFDLHVLSTPPAFVLSQDQTLHKKISEQNSETGREKPETQQKKQTTTNHTTMQPVLASKKLLQRKNTKFPQPDGVKKRKPKKLNTITCQPIHLKAAETPNSIQKGTCSTYPTGTHQPTNHLGLLADKPINTQPCTQKIKSTLAHY